MIRTLSMLVGLLVVAVGVALARQAMLYARIDRIVTTLTVLQARLEPVTPIDTLCLLSGQLTQVYEAMGSHCSLTHLQDLPVLMQPPVCTPYRLHDG